MKMFFLWVMVGILTLIKPGGACLDPGVRQNILRHFQKPFPPRPVIHKPKPIFLNPFALDDPIPTPSTSPKEEEGDDDDGDVLYFDDTLTVLNDPEESFLDDFRVLGNALAHLPILKKSSTPHGVPLPFWGKLANACVGEMPLDDGVKTHFYGKIAAMQERTYLWFLYFLHYAAHHLLGPIGDFDRVKNLPQESKAPVFKWNEFWALQKNVQENIQYVIAPLFPKIIVLPCPYDLTLDDLIQTMPNPMGGNDRTWLIPWMHNPKHPVDFFEGWNQGLCQLRRLGVHLLDSPDDINRFFKRVSLIQSLEDHYMDNPHLLTDSENDLVQLFFLDFMRLSDRPVHRRLDPIDEQWFLEHESFLQRLGFRCTKWSLIYLNEFYNKIRLKIMDRENSDKKKTSLAIN